MLSPLAALATQIREGDVALAAALILIAMWAGCRVLVVTSPVRATSWLAGACRLFWQLGALLGIEQAYEFTRGRITRTNVSDVAFLHAYRVFDFELHHGLFFEQRLQHLVLGWGPVMNAIDYFYVLAHVGVTLGVLIWVYLRHRDRYPFVRNLLMVTTAIALVAFYVYPTAPPRFLTGYGFVDPATTNHLVEAGGAQPGSYTYNPYAAMPSLHVAYALVASWGVLLCARRWWVQMLAALYPVAMTFTVLATANHWVLDVVGAVVAVAAAGVVVAILGLAAMPVQRVFVGGFPAETGGHESSQGVPAA